MKSRILVFLTVLLCFCVISNGATARNEKPLTATNSKIVAEEDKEFNAAFKVWMGHRYEEGAKMLEEFAKKHPNSRRAAEAELHY